MPQSRGGKDIYYVRLAFVLKTVYIEGISMEKLQLQIEEISTRNGNQYQCIEMAIADSSGMISPHILGEIILPPNLDLTRGVILWGAVPTWLAAHIVRCCSQAPWVGCFDIQSGSVVVAASNSSELAAGDSFRFAPDKTPGNAVFIGGPPDSGKSVLSYALARSLKVTRQDKAIHLHRAQWDGEGNWFAEASDRAFVEQLSQYYKAVWSERFFLYHANAITNIREAVDLALVDFGGKPKRRDVTLLNRCTHYIIISSKPELIPEWHNFCAQRGGLKPLAVIHSVLDERVEVVKTEPFLEIVAGPWVRGKTVKIPDQLLIEMLKLLPYSHFK